jgi:hypothetical protein
MAYYAVQHTYEWPCAHGLELFHLHLSAVAKEVCIQAAPWHSFKNGSRKNGCTWRYILKSPDKKDHVVIVTCNIVVTQEHWTLTTAVHEDEASTNGYVFIGDLDPWTRAVEWTLKLHELIGGFDLGDLDVRFELSQEARKLLFRVVPIVRSTFENMFHCSCDLPSEITLIVADWNLRDGKIGSYKYTGDFPFGIMTIGLNAFERGAMMVYWVMAHELAHASIGDRVDDDHGEEFKAFATALNVPEGYQD